jgi:hypothetical protein
MNRIEARIGIIQEKYPGINLDPVKEHYRRETTKKLSNPEKT